MFGQRNDAPPETPFQHSDDCKTPDAQPEWGYVGAGRWERTCGCHAEVHYTRDTRLDPNSTAAEPSWRAHEHDPSCDASNIAAVVRIERRSPDGGWRSTCHVCTTTCIYWWDPQYTDHNGRRITREGSIFYQYELGRAPVAV
ncbi:MAG TPA: hypothetical protein VFI46_17465 [Jiangellaceae bacterium]|nr:hypothetical protein [Jiangellaceae bacterium]